MFYNFQSNTHTHTQQWHWWRWDRDDNKKHRTRIICSRISKSKRNRAQIPPVAFGKARYMSTKRKEKRQNFTRFRFEYMWCVSRAVCALCTQWVGVVGFEQCSEIMTIWHRRWKEHSRGQMVSKLSKKLIIHVIDCDNCIVCDLVGFVCSGLVYYNCIYL